MVSVHLMTQASRNALNQSRTRKSVFFKFIRSGFWTDLNGCRQRLLFERQLVPRKCSLCSQGIIVQAYQSRCCSWRSSSQARIAWDVSTLFLRLKQGQVSKINFENDIIRNRISNDFDKRCISQPKVQQTNQPWITQNNLVTSSISFGTSSGKRQLKTSQDYSKPCQLQQSVSKFPDAA